MRTRRSILLFIVGVVLVGMLAFGVFPERESEYGGKKLSEWVVLRPWWFRQGPSQAEITEDAGIAIRQIGEKEREMRSNGNPENDGRKCTRRERTNAERERHELHKFPPTMRTG